MIAFPSAADGCLTTTIDALGAKDVYLEETETGDGYYLGVIVDGFVKYINMVERDGTVICAYEDWPETAYTFSEESVTLVAYIDGEEYCFGVDGDPGLSAGDH